MLHGRLGFRNPFRRSLAGSEAGAPMHEAQQHEGGLARSMQHSDSDSARGQADLPAASSLHNFWLSCLSAKACLDAHAYIVYPM